MSFKNSFRLLTTNFSVVWKQLLYLLIISVFSFGIAYCIFLPALDILKSEGVISQFAEIFETIYTAPKEIITACKDAILHLFEVIKSNFSIIGANVIFSLFFAKFVFDVLKYISYYNVTNVMYMKLTSYLDIGYTRNLISNIWPSLRYALSRFVLSVPFDLIIAVCLILFLKFISGTLTIIFGLFIFIAIFIVITSIKISLFTPFATVMIEKQYPPFKAFMIGNKKIKKSFTRVFSNAIVAIMTLIVANLFLGVFTVGAGLLITIPATLVFICILNLTSYLGASGERYYLTDTIIVNSSKTDKETK